FNKEKLRKMPRSLEVEINPEIIKWARESAGWRALIFFKLGFDPKKKRIREQEPNPFPDRETLDDNVFYTLGLPKERKEVYW
ncbi:MAG: hypothetical protein ACK4FM_01630, partial [Caldimicrobium sp.]